MQRSVQSPVAPKPVHQELASKMACKQHLDSRCFYRILARLVSGVHPKHVSNSDYVIKKFKMDLLRYCLTILPYDAALRYCLTILPYDAALRYCLFQATGMHDTNRRYSAIHKASNRMRPRSCKDTNLSAKSSRHFQKIKFHCSIAIVEPHRKAVEIGKLANCFQKGIMTAVQLCANAGSSMTTKAI